MTTSGGQGLVHDARFPGESDKCRHARDELLRAEIDLHPRHVDFMWPLWAVLDRTPEGRGTDWAPELDYL